ncbi:hypothetical protein ABZY09_30680 [Streptomyces sp. NPDC002928]|uniref:hypothetical protein n=1 Tax=Streptomyces sp. NPDC002928 TaxID=3154440 RepID=UPI0033A86212
MGHIFAHITCTRVKWEASITELAEQQSKAPEALRAEWEGDTDYDAASDTVRLEDALEEHGWIDRSWSVRVLHDSRNDVRPVVDVDESDAETLAEEITDALEWLEGGYEDNGDGTFYASDSYRPYDEPWSYSYALHFVRKFHGPNGWTEQAWHPKSAGIDV